MDDNRKCSPPRNMNQRSGQRKTTIHAQVDPFTDFERPVWMRSDRGSVSFEAKEEPFSSEEEENSGSDVKQTRIF